MLHMVVGIPIMQVGDNSFDLPDANVLIQISAHGGYSPTAALASAWSRSSESMMHSSIIPTQVTWPTILCDWICEKGSLGAGKNFQFLASNCRIEFEPN